MEDGIERELSSSRLPVTSVQIPVPSSSIYSPFFCVSGKGHGASKFLMSFSKTVVLNLWVKIKNLGKIRVMK